MRPSIPKLLLAAVMPLAVMLLAVAADDRTQRTEQPVDLEEPHHHDAGTDLGLRTTPDPLASDPSTAGQWTAPMTWPASAVHLIVLRTGEVIWWRGDEDTPTTYTWNPTTLQLQSQTVSAIIWCGGNSVLPDGRVLATGGATQRGASTGPRHAFLFDPDTRLWTRTVDMRKGRYYPTHTLLGDGRTLVFSGTDENGATNEQIESFVPGGGPGGADLWQLLGDRLMTYYPRMHLLPDGRIVHVGPEKTTDLLDPAVPSWQTVSSTLYGKRTHGTSVMLPPGFQKIMITAGRDRSLTDPLATNTAEIIDFSQPTPTWNWAAPMNNRRMHANTVIMPDGKIIVAGGTSDEDVTPVYPAEIYDPAAGTWTVVASMATKRGYHSSAVLLPDARVLWAGANGNNTAEVYSPPYLFRGPRPVLGSAPASVSYDQSFTVQTPDAASIRSVVFMRPGASTHSINMEQRYVPLTFSQSGPDTLQITAPSEPNTAPPGYYMLFLLDGNQIPSVARFVSLGVSLTANRRPSVDAGPGGTIILPATANLDGTVSDDGLPNPPGAIQSLVWSKESGPGSVSFGDAGSVDTTADFSEPGTYVLRLTVSDGELTGTDTTTVVATDASSAGYPLEYRIASGTDDVEEKAGGSISVTSSDLEMTLDSDVQKIGLRFNAVRIPQGERIVRAWVQFKVDEATSETTSLLIQGHAADSAGPFLSTALNVSSRPRTSASVAWTPAPWPTVGEVGPNQKTPDLAPIIQEIVNRPGWASGNSIALIITGTGKRVAKAYEGLPAGAALLHVETATPPVNGIPVVSAGADQTIRMPAGVVLDATVTDDGLPNPPGAVTTLWVKESGPGTGVVTFANPSSIDTTATFSQPGRYVLELEANDGELLGTGAMAVDVLEAVQGLTALDAQVAAGSDDAEEKASGSMSLTSSDLELVTDSSVQTVGMRFNGLALPRGATIHGAYLQFQTDAATSDSTALTIKGQAADNPGTFTTTKKNVSLRARTTAAVAWTPAPWPVKGEAAGPQRSPDLSAIVQEIVNRAGWNSGQSMVFIVTGSGRRTASAFEAGAPKAVKLHIEYAP
jgi:hypothetical protein